MPAHLRAHATYANVVATLCLVAVLTAGTAWAAPRFTGRDIVNNSIASTDIANNSIRGIDVRTGAIGRPDLAPGVRPAYASSQRLTFNALTSDDYKVVYESAAVRVIADCDEGGFGPETSVQVRSKVNNSKALSVYYRAGGLETDDHDMDFDLNDQFVRNHYAITQGLVDIVTSSGTHTRLEYSASGGTRCNLNGIAYTT